MTHQPPSPSPDQVEVRHGFTMVDILRLAGRAAVASRWKFIEFHHRRDVAWSAIAEALYGREAAPSAYELFGIGGWAIRAYAVDLGPTRGGWTTPMPAPDRQRGSNRSGVSGLAGAFTR